MRTLRPAGTVNVRNWKKKKYEMLRQKLKRLARKKPNLSEKKKNLCRAWKERRATMAKMWGPVTGRLVLYLAKNERGTLKKTLKIEGGEMRRAL